MDLKRREADARLVEWERLTITQQIASLKERRGESKRQMARLEKS